MPQFFPLTRYSIDPEWLARQSAPIPPQVPSGIGPVPQFPQLPQFQFPFDPSAAINPWADLRFSPGQTLSPTQSLQAIPQASTFQPQGPLPAELLQQPGPQPGPQQGGFLNQILSMLGSPGIQGLIAGLSAMQMTPKWAGRGYAMGAGTMAGMQQLAQAQETRAQREREQWSRGIAAERLKIEQERERREQDKARDERTAFDQAQEVFRSLPVQERARALYPSLRSPNTNEAELAMRAARGDPIAQRALEVLYDMKKRERELTSLEKREKEARIAEITARTKRMGHITTPKTLATMSPEELSRNQRRALQDLRDVEMLFEEEDSESMKSALQAEAKSYADELARRRGAPPAVQDQPSAPADKKPGRYRMDDGTIRIWDGKKWLPPER